MVNRFENSLPLIIAQVNVRMHEAKNEILSEENFDDGLATQEREAPEFRNSLTRGALLYCVALPEIEDSPR